MKDRLGSKGEDFSFASVSCAPKPSVVTLKLVSWFATPVVVFAVANAVVKLKILLMYSTFQNVRTLLVLQTVQKYDRILI